MSRRQKNKKYSAELKLKAVKDYLNGGGSQREICIKYEISSRGRLHDWIIWYNGHREFKERSSAKGEIYMTKRKKNNAGRTSRNSSLLHRTRKGLWFNNRNLQGIISADICLGTKIRRKRSTGLDRPPRKSQA